MEAYFDKPAVLTAPTAARPIGLWLDFYLDRTNENLKAHLAGLKSGAVHEPSAAELISAFLHKAAVYAKKGGGVRLMSLASMVALYFGVGVLPELEALLDDTGCSMFEDGLREHAMPAGETPPWHRSKEALLHLWTVRKWSSTPGPLSAGRRSQHTVGTSPSADGKPWEDAEMDDAVGWLSKSLPAETALAEAPSDEQAAALLVAHSLAYLCFQEGRTTQALPWFQLTKTMLASGAFISGLVIDNTAIDSCISVCQSLATEGVVPTPDDSLPPTSLNPAHFSRFGLSAAYTASAWPPVVSLSAASSTPSAAPSLATGAASGLASGPPRLEPRDAATLVAAVPSPPSLAPHQAVVASEKLLKGPFASRGIASASCLAENDSRLRSWCSAAALATQPWREYATFDEHTDMRGSRAGTNAGAGAGPGDSIGLSRRGGSSLKDAAGHPVELRTIGLSALLLGCCAASDSGSDNTDGANGSGGSSLKPTLSSSSSSVSVNTLLSALSRAIGRVSDRSSDFTVSIAPELAFILEKSSLPLLQWLATVALARYCELTPGVSEAFRATGLPTLSSASSTSPDPLSAASSGPRFAGASTHGISVSPEVVLAIAHAVLLECESRLGPGEHGWWTDYDGQAVRLDRSELAPTLVNTLPDGCWISACAGLCLMCRALSPSALAVSSVAEAAPLPSSSLPPTVARQALWHLVSSLGHATNAPIDAQPDPSASKAGSVSVIKVGPASPFAAAVLLMASKCLFALGKVSQAAALIQFFPEATTLQDAVLRELQTSAPPPPSASPYFDTLWDLRFVEVLARSYGTAGEPASKVASALYKLCAAPERNFSNPAPARCRTVMWLWARTVRLLVDEFVCG